MKIKMIYLIIVILSITQLFAQQKSTSYNYPVKPGSADWNALSSHEQKKQVCQIPNSILVTMSTTDLIETCLHYPLLGDIIAFDRMQQGFEHVTKGFNGLQELLQRKDFGTVLFEKYKKMNPNDIDSNWTNIKKGEFSAQFFFIELLLAQDAAITDLSKNDRTLLLGEAYNKIVAKGKHPDIFGLIGFTNNTLLMGRIMIKENYAPFMQSVSQSAKLNNGMFNAMSSDKEDMNQIIKDAKQYLGQN